VWRAFGHDVPNYIAPFCGSLAVELARPGGAGKIETVNDRDRYLANFWRAVTADPWEVAAWADNPVNEADLHARHKWLVNQQGFRQRMHEDPDYYDAKVAGWWVWGICCWIGGGWCVEPNSHKRPVLGGTTQGRGVHSQRAGGAQRGHPRPNLNSGQGVHAQGANRGQDARRPHLSAVKADGACAGKGIHSDAAVEAYSPGRRPELGFAGKGVHLPSLGNDRGVHGLTAPKGTFFRSLHDLTVPEAPPCFAWFAALMLRLRRVRVACGDWRRVLTDSVLGKGKNVGGRRPCAVFLDPPYAHEFRDPYLYSEDDPAVSALVREWALEHGNDPELRIALCGYAGEHEMPATWTEHAWKGARGYASEDNSNRELERIWFSPHCLPLESKPEPTLW
jgi:hypothetical protein